MLASIGLNWRSTGIIWSGYNPHPGIADVQPEVVFIGAGPDNDRPFNPDSVIASGLQEMVMIFAGEIRADRPVAGASLTVTPLLQTGVVSGQTEFNSLLTRNFLGGMQINPNPRRFQSGEAYTLAMQVNGTIPPSGADAGAESGTINVIVVSDVDVISETFFNLRRQGFEEFNFDNVTFALNCIDLLAGDESFITLRKHRPRHRSLTLVEAQNEQYADLRRGETEAAEDEAISQLDQARQRLDVKVTELRARTDLDEQTKAIMLRNLEEVENRRFTVVEANIEQAKQKRVDRARNEMNIAIAGIQRTIKWWAAVLPPIPTLLLAIAFFAHRTKREKIGVSERQLVEAK